MSDHIEDKNTTQDTNKNTEKKLVGFFNTETFTTEDAQKIIDSIK